MMIIGNELIQHDIVSEKLRRLVESHFVEISKDMFCPASPHIFADIGRGNFDNKPTIS